MKIKMGIEEVIKGWLEDYTLEELFEELDLDPSEVIFKLYESGMIDEDRLGDFLEVDDDSCS